MQHGDAVGERQRDIDVVLDHDQRDVARQLARSGREKRCRSLGERPAHGSSSSSDFRARTRARARARAGAARRRRGTSPVSSARPSRPTRDSPRAPRSRRSENAAAGRCMIHLRRSVPSIASCRFSITVRSVQTLEIWNVRPMPSAVRRCSASLVMSAAEQRARVPAVGLQRAGDAVKQRGLAGAVRADQHAALARLRPTSETSSTARSPPNTFAEPLDRDGAVRAHAPSPRSPERQRAISP